MENTNQESKVEQVLTGKLYFQFDKEEPFEIQEIFNNENASLLVPAPVVPLDGVNPIHSVLGGLEFKQGDRRFRIFIKNE